MVAVAMADGRFDDLLLGLASKHKNAEEVLVSILSFLERRTDLFHIMETPNDRMGFMPGVAEKMILKQFRFFQHRYWSRAQPCILDRIAERSRPVGGDQLCVGSGDEATISRSQNTGGDAKRDGSMEAAVAGIASSSSTSGTPSTSPAAPPAAAAASSVDRNTEEKPALPDSTRKMMRHISTWNGAITEKYHWSQSLREVTLEVEIPEECRAKDVQVDVTATRICIKFKGKTMLEGKLHEKVTIEETMWHLDNSRQVVLSLEKQRETWWKCVLEGDQAIDTTKVESTRSMEEYDGETQGAIRKIMFDQCQKLQGKASSDQIRTAEVMRDAWNAPGSPFRGTEFDPTMLNLSGPVPDDFFQELEKKRIEESRQQKEQQTQGQPPQ